MASARRAGLLACDDFPTTLRMLAVLNGEKLTNEPAAIVSLAAVLGGIDLVRYLLSDKYHRLREVLQMPSTTGESR